MRTAALVLVLVGSIAEAHIALTSPQPRYSDLKLGPCGRGSLDARTQNVTTFSAGETITVRWTETIDHPGHYRIAFDDDGQDGFLDPTSFTDVNGGPGVLLDGIADKAGGAYEAQVTLPNAPCSNCTLQLIQVMTDKPPYGDGNDLYYQCADVVLVAADGGEPDAGTPAVDPPDGGFEPPPDDDIRTACGCTAGADLVLFPAAIVALALGRRSRR